eukprot:COSAG02_NODE_11315_length_1749_cov_1.478182_2_plen_225_part_01
MPNEIHPGGIRFVGDKSIFVIDVDEGIEDGASHGGRFGVTVRRGAATEVTSPILSSPQDAESRRADEVILRGYCQKKKAHLRSAWRDRHVRIAGTGLFLYEDDEHTVTGYQVSSFNAVRLEKTWYCLNLDREDGAVSLRFHERHIRNMFFTALQNLSKGRTWNGIGVEADAKPDTEQEPEPEPEVGIASDTLVSASAHGSDGQAHQLRVGGSAVTYTSSRDMELD